MIATGVTEIEPDRPGTLYNTLLIHEADGRLVLQHRKLVPTNHEHLVWPSAITNDPTSSG